MLIQITVDLREKRLPDGGLDWSAPWQAPQDAAAECKTQGLTADEGQGKAYAVYVNGFLANKTKEHQKIVKAVVADVKRRLSFLK